MFLTYKRKRAEHHLKLIEGKKSKIKTDEFRDRIISVSPIGMQYVYNLNAGNTHTYLANGIVTHNTGGSKEANFPDVWRSFSILPGTIYMVCLMYSTSPEALRNVSCLWGPI